MGILHIEYRIVLRRFDHLGKVKVHLRIGFARKHREADDILADFFNHIGERDKAARPFGHFNGLTAAQQAHHLHKLNIEIDFAIGQRVDRRLDALDGTRMIRAPDVDHGVNALTFLEMIGKVSAEIGPAAVGFLDWPVLIIAKLRRPEQGKRNRLPIFDVLALWLFQFAVIDKAARAQFALGNVRLARFMQLGFG